MDETVHENQRCTGAAKVEIIHLYYSEHEGDGPICGAAWTPSEQVDPSDPSVQRCIVCEEFDSGSRCPVCGSFWGETTDG